MRTIGPLETLLLVAIWVVVPVVALIIVYLVRRLQTQERLRAIEKGVLVPLNPADPWEHATRARRRGITFTAGGLGLLVFFTVALIFGDRRESAILGMAFTAIPILIGLGFVYEYRLCVRDLRARHTPQASPDTIRGV